MRLHLIRHPRPVIAAGICYGQLEIQAKIESAELARLRAGLPSGLPLWSSPLLRCRQLAEQLHPQPIIDARLAEMNFGTWEGRRWDDIPRHELDAWAADVDGYAPPGGESPRQMQQRVLDFLATLAVPEALVVTHAGVMRLVHAHVTGISVTEALAYRPDYGEVLSVRWPAARNLRLG